MNIDIVHALGIHGWMEPFELTWLAERALEAGMIIEIGSFKGRSTRALADHCDGTVYVVENWVDAKDHADGTAAEMVVAGRLAIECEWKANLAEHIESGRIVLLRGHSPDVAPALRAHVGAGADFVFIDADHSYDGVLADIFAYEPLVRPGGILAGHDFTTAVHPGVRRAVEDYFGGRAQRGPGSIWWIRL